MLLTQASGRLWVIKERREVLFSANKISEDLGGNVTADVKWTEQSNSADSVLSG